MTIPSKIRTLIENQVAWDIISEKIDASPEDLLNSENDDQNPLFAAQYAPPNIKEQLNTAINRAYFKDGTTPFIAAAINGDLEYTKILLEQNEAVLEEIDNRGHSALYWAAAAGHFSLIIYYLSLPQVITHHNTKDQLIAGLIALHWNYIKSNQDAIKEENASEILAYYHLLKELTIPNKRSLITVLIDFGTHLANKLDFQTSNRMFTTAQTICRRFNPADSTMQQLIFDLDYKIRKNFSTEKQLLGYNSFITDSLFENKFIVQILPSNPTTLFYKMRAILNFAESPPDEKNAFELCRHLLSFAENAAYFVVLACMEDKKIEVITHRTTEFLSLLSQIMSQPWWLSIGEPSSPLASGQIIDQLGNEIKFVNLKAILTMLMNVLWHHQKLSTPLKTMPLHPILWEKVHMNFEKLTSFLKQYAYECFHHIRTSLLELRDLTEQNPSLSSETDTRYLLSATLVGCKKYEEGDLDCSELHFRNAVDKVRQRKHILMIANRTVDNVIHALEQCVNLAQNTRDLLSIKKKLTKLDIMDWLLDEPYELPTPPVTTRAQDSISNEPSESAAHTINSNQVAQKPSTYQPSFFTSLPFSEKTMKSMAFIDYSRP